MHITAQCHCGAAFELEPRFAGMTVECAQYRQRFVVPQILTQ